MAVYNRVPELLETKFGGHENINITHESKAVGITSDTFRSWMRGSVTRYDNESLDKWCKYFGLPEGDMVIVYKPDRSEDD